MSIAKLFKNDWVITLTATLVGVFLAMYLNERVSSSKMESEKKAAIENIIAEIDSNKVQVITSLEEHERLLALLSFVMEYTDEENSMIVHQDTMNSYRSKYPDYISMSDSTLVSNRIYEYEGQLDLSISTTHIDLSTLALQTLKTSNYSGMFKFACLMKLERINKLTHQVLEHDETLFDYLAGGKDPSEKNENLLNHLQMQINAKWSIRFGN